VAEGSADRWRARGYRDVTPAASPPAKSAPKADWVAYAVSQGQDDADALTKAELVDLYS
jgi:hypothetical protein